MKPKKPGCGEAGAEPRFMARVALPGSCPGPTQLHPQSRNKALTGTIIVQILLSLDLKVNMGGSWRGSVLNSKKIMKRGEAGPRASCRAELGRQVRTAELGKTSCVKGRTSKCLRRCTQSVLSLAPCTRAVWHFQCVNRTSTSGLAITCKHCVSLGMPLSKTFTC